MKITLRQLEVFVAVAKNENMSQAAEVLHLSQSACSMALSALENQLNDLLFDRHGKRLVLNERGRILLPKAYNIIAQATELQDLMTPDKERFLAGHLIVGASSTIGNYLLPELIGNFVTDYPKVKISLQVANTEQTIRKLLQFDIDVGIIEGRCNAQEIKVTPWRKDGLIVISSPQTTLYKKAKVTLNDLRNAKWILREVGSGTRERFEEAMGGPVSPFLELGHTEAIKQAVRAGLGMSCLSKVTVSDALKRGELVELKTPFLKLTRDFYILLHKKKYQTAILSTFIKKISLASGA